MCKINIVKFHYFMKSSSKKSCKILQARDRKQDKMLESARFTVRFQKDIDKFWVNTNR